MERTRRKWQAMRAPVASETSSDDPPVNALRQPVGAVMRARSRSVSGSPARYRSTHRLTVADEHPNRSPTLRIGHQRHLASPSLRSQQCISARHEGLLVRTVSVITHILPRRPSPYPHRSQPPEEVHLGQCGHGERQQRYTVGLRGRRRAR